MQININKGIPYLKKETKQKSNILLTIDPPLSPPQTL